MEIITVQLSDIRGYENNAKLHPQSQIEQIKQSIHDFGFNDPIAIDENNVIIEGHGRFKAVQQLGWQEIPCIRLSHMTEQQKKAYILAHNKLTMNTDFDPDMLAMELEGIIDFDMEEYGFDIPDIFDEPDEPKEKKSHRDMTNRHYNLEMFDASRCSGFYEMPTIRKSSFIPSDLIGFNYALTSKNKRAGIHCFVDDYQFSRLWNNPDAYIETIAGYECFLSPDFSLYLDMPMAMKVWNIYRSRLIGQYYQDHGIEVIPTVSWAEPETFAFCFDGIEEGATVAVSTIGVKRNEYAQKIWQQGMDEMIKIVKPANILLYGGVVEYDYKGIPIFEYNNHVTENMRQGDKKGGIDYEHSAEKY